MNNIYLMVAHIMLKKGKIIIPVLFVLLQTVLNFTVQAQLSFTNGAATALINFSNSMPTTVGSNPSTAFAGAGYQPNTAFPGRLNSNAWSGSGWSDPALAFGGTATGNDYGRGSVAVAVTQGGIYSYTGAPHSVADPALMFQPGGSDFTPGNMTLRIKNDGSSIINKLVISYKIYQRNDQNRSNSFNFSYSYDDVNYTAIPAYNYTTPGAFDLAGWVLGASMNDSITGLNIPPTTMFYLRWTSDDVSGSSSRDEIGLDDINISANYPGACTPPTTNATLNSFSNVFTSQMDVNFTRGNGTGGVLIVASPIALSLNPISGITYTANSNYGSGSAIGNGFVVYSGNAVPVLTAGSFTLTNLTAGTNYVLTLFEYDVTVPCYTATGVSGNQTTSGSSTTLATDLFRSKANGDWANANTWESFTGGTWIGADISPTAASAGISVLATHTVNITSTVNMDQVTVAGTLTLLNGGIINLNDGTGFDIDIQNAGILNIHTSTSYSSSFIITAGATMNVATNGKITIGNGASSSGYSPLGTSATLVTWNNASILEWNTTDPFVTSSATYFPGVAAGVIPIFRVSQSPSLQPGSSNPTVWNGLFEVNANLTLKLAGTKTFRNGITGTATLTQDELCGQFIINGATAVLGGTGAINLYNAGMDINASVTTMISNKTINSTLSVGTLSVNAAGSLYCDSYVISGSAIFSLATGCTMRLGSPGGISVSGATGNIQVSGLRTFSVNTIFIYNGTTNQVTGNGLPATITSLTINNTGLAGNNTVNLTTTNTTTAVLNLTAGLFAAGAGQQLNISNGGTVNPVAGNFVTGATCGIINFLGSGSFTASCTPYDVYTSGGVNFGLTPIVVTIQNGGSFRINTGGFASTNGPFYATGSTLIYNTGLAGYGIGVEWVNGVTSGRGVPHHVTILASGTTILFGGALTPRTMTGNMTINSGTGLVLGTAIGGDLLIGGNWTRAATGTFTNNARMVAFNGTTANQTVTVTGGGMETFAFLTITKPDAFTFIMAAAPNATNITVNGNPASVAPVTTLLLSGNLELNQNTFNFTSWNGNQNHIRIDNVAGASTIRNISSAGGQGVFALYNSVANNSSVEIFRISTGPLTRRTTLVFGSTVKVTIGAVAGGTGGIDFGSRGWNPPSAPVASTPISTINGIFQIDIRGFVTVNAPTYGASSTLIYNATGTYNRNIEWGSTQVQPGYPYHVIIQNNDTLNLNNTQNTPNANRYLAGNLTISPGSSLILNNTGTYTPNILTVGGNFVLDGTITLPGTLPAFGEDLHIVGNWTRSATGVFNPNDRAVYFEGGINSAITANGGETFPYLRLTKSLSTNSLSLNSDINITKEISLTTGTFNLLNNNVNMKSDANYTASITAINPATASVSYGSGTGTGRFVVERFIPTNTGAAPNHGKTWQFLAIPTNNAGVAGGQTVNAGWQEGNAPLIAGTAGLGTIISSNVAGTGFDIVGGVGPSMKTYDPATASWKGITRTDSTLYNKKGYMIFVRGDRTVTAYNGTATPTNLRSTGKIMEPNNLPPTTTVGANQFETVGNPYASAIDFRSAGVLKGGNLQDVFYVWDPRLGSVLNYGAFQTCIRSGADYAVIPGGGSYVSGINNFIQSGQAFFVRADAGGGSIGFNENAKVSGSALFTRPATTVSNNDMVRKLTNRLYAVTNGSRVLVDGVFNEFGMGMSYNVDNLDALKLSNNGENLGISVNGKILAVERRGFFRRMDTIQYEINQLKLQQQYQFEFTASNITGLAQRAFLVDKWLGTYTPVSLSNVTMVNFSITSDRGSYASDRFMLVFGRNGKPFLYSKLKAERQENSVLLNWNSNTENDMLAYEVQRSADGVSFTGIHRVTATGKGKYSWVDNNPLPTNNYYRIQVTGQEKDNYSNKVKVIQAQEGTAVRVIPNPVKNMVLNLYFTENINAGNYSLKLYNNAGQLAWSGNASIKSGQGKTSIQLPVSLAKGNYQLEVREKDTKPRVLQVFID